MIHRIEVQRDENGRVLALHALCALCAGLGPDLSLSRLARFCLHGCWVLGPACSAWKGLAHVRAPEGTSRVGRGSSALVLRCPEAPLYESPLQLPARRIYVSEWLFAVWPKSCTTFETMGGLFGLWPKSGTLKPWLKRWSVGICGMESIHSVGFLTGAAFGFRFQPFPIFFSTIALSKNRIPVPWVSGGFLERFGSLERKDMEATPRCVLV